MAWSGKVPFDKNGNMMSFFSSWRDETMKELEPFTDTVTICDRVVSGRSAKRLMVVRHSTGKQYPLFMRDLLDAIFKIGVEQGGSITATWGAVKRGRNYGIKVIE